MLGTNGGGAGTTRSSEQGEERRRSPGLHVDMRNKKVKVCGLLHLKTDENRVFDVEWTRFGHT